MSTAALDPTTFVPDEGLGNAKIVDFVAALRQRGLAAPEATARLTGGDGTSIDLPDELFRMLKLAAENLAAGRAITLAPLDTQLTTQEAAEFLGMSRPSLIKIIDAGALPCTKVGRHRKLLLRDLIAYRDDQKRLRREALDEMIDIALDNELYELTAGSGEGIR